ncbi:hypothetical protein HK102_010970 [Quaeritorhiza haematococci]|nr:hypothetical protein HK102_010970 [Quaeritorhiza haematococci]
MAETVRSDEPGPTAKESKLCSVCGRKIEGQFVRALNGHYHLECFRCQDCNQVVAEKFFPLEGPSGPQIFCEKDYFRRLDLLCAKCGGALRGPHINALNKKYHLEHFTCSVCPTVFRQHDSYYERDGEVYCQYHYSVRYAAKCGGCQTAVLKNFVEMNKENTVEQWHPECYMIYKLWNVKVASSKHGPLVPATSQPSASTEEEVRKQQVTVEKVGRILHVLSAFEESSAECISDMLIHFSNQHYEDGVLQAGKFICHIEALFTGIDEIEAQLGKHGDRTGLQHTKEPKQLAKKIVTFFSLLSLARESTQRQEATKELISLVTSLARALKILIRAALNGALKLERSYGSDTAVDDFLDKLMSLGEVRDANDERRLRASYSPQVKTDLCPVCRKSVEEECVKFGNLRWHSACFKCSTCGKELRSTYKDAMYDETSSRIYCGEHATSASKIGFEKVTQLEQYTFLLRCALKRLCILLNVRIDSHVAGEPEVISEKIKRSNEILLPAGEDADALARKVSRSKGAVPGADMEQMQVPSLSNAAHHDTMVSYPDDFRSSLKKEVEVEGVMPPRPATQTPLSQHSPSPTPQPLPPQQQQQPLQPTAQLQPLQPQPQLLQQQALQTVPQQINTSLGPRPDNGANGVKSPFSPPHGLQKALSSGEQGYPLGIGLPGSGPNAAANAVLAAGLGPSPIPEGFGSISAAVKAGRPVYLSELGPLEHLAVRQLAALKMHPLMEKFYTWDELMEFADMRKPSMWSKMVEAMKPVGKKNQKVKVEGTFGVPLEILVERYGIETEMGPGPTSTRIPLIMDACVRTLRNMDLRVEGIFRKNGNIKRLKTVTEALDRDPLSIDLSEDGPIQVAALMKKFLRDMPEPLLTFKLHKLFIAAQKLPDEKSRREALHYVCCLLPKPNLDLLEVLLWFLREVAQYSSTVGDEASGNRMDIDNLATVITPNILYSKSKNPADDESFLAIQALRMLLRYQNEMWLVPENVVEALREDRTAFELANADPNAKEKDLKKIDDVLVKMKKSQQQAYVHEVTSDIQQGTTARIETSYA